MKVVTIDCQYLFSEYAAAYLITDGKRGLIVDNNTTHSVPLILKAIEAEGLKPSDIDFLIVTHVHLDHAGGTSALLKACPNAQVLAHPRAAKHLIDPEKLISSAQSVYGAENFQKLYGKIEPIPSEKIRVMQDEELLTWQASELKFLHTRGHANHHFCILLSYLGKPEAVFTGDAFGIAYPEHQKRGVFAFVSTSPTDFDPEEARRSIARIRDSGARVAYPTHFGALTDLKEASRQLLEGVDVSEAILKEALSSSMTASQDLTAFCKTRLEDYFSQRLLQEGFGDLTGEAAQTKAGQILQLDIELNAAGIAYVAQKMKKGTAE